MDDAELSSHLTQFYRFAHEFVRVSGDLSKMQEFLISHSDAIQFSVSPRHIAALRNRGSDGVSLWEFSSLIQDAMTGFEVPSSELRRSLHRAYLELWLFDSQTVSDDLKDSQRDIVLTITEAGKRLTTAEVLQQLAEKSRLWGESTVKNELANLVTLDKLDNKRKGPSKGYGLKGWS